MRNFENNAEYYMKVVELINSLIPCHLLDEETSLLYEKTEKLYVIFIENLFISTEYETFEDFMDTISKIDYAIENYSKKSSLLSFEEKVLFFNDTLDIISLRSEDYFSDKRESDLSDPEKLLFYLCNNLLRLKLTFINIEGI
jgi:hypothetical protein